MLKIFLFYSCSSRIYFVFLFLLHLFMSKCFFFPSYNQSSTALFIFFNLHGTATIMHICIYNRASGIRMLPSVVSLPKFWVSFTASIVWARATFNNYWSVDIQLLLERPFNHKSWFIVAFLTIPLKCCLANQVHSLSWRTNLLQGCQNKSLW